MRPFPALPAGVLLSIGVSTGCAVARPDWNVALDHTSRYVARGVVLFDGPAWQPSVTATADTGEGTWSGGAWGTIDGNDDGANRGNFTEVDFYVEHERVVGPLKTTFGLLRYVYPHTGFPASGEVHLAAGYENEIATPTLHLWYDYDEGDGSYVDLELARSFDLDERWSLALSASSGWMSSGQGAYYFGVDASGFSDFTTTAALSFAPAETFGLALTLGWASVLDDDLRQGVADGDNGWVMLGASLDF